MIYFGFWLQPGPFYDILEQSITLYDQGEVQGFYLFAGTSLAQMNASLWDEWALPDTLEQTYFRYLGGGTLSVAIACSTSHLMVA